MPSNSSDEGPQCVGGRGGQCPQDPIVWRPRARARSKEPLSAEEQRASAADAVRAAAVLADRAKEDSSAVAAARAIFAAAPATKPYLNRGPVVPPKPLYRPGRAVQVDSIRTRVESESAYGFSARNHITINRFQTLLSNSTCAATTREVVSRKCRHETGGAWPLLRFQLTASRHSCVLSHKPLVNGSQVNISNLLMLSTHSCAFLPGTTGSYPTEGAQVEHPQLCSCPWNCNQWHLSPIEHLENGSQLIYHGNSCTLHQTP